MKIDTTHKKDPPRVHVPYCIYLRDTRTFSSEIFEYIQRLMSQDGS